MGRAERAPPNPSMFFAGGARSARPTLQLSDLPQQKRLTPRPKTWTCPLPSRPGTLTRRLARLPRRTSAYRVPSATRPDWRRRSGSPRRWRSACCGGRGIGGVRWRAAFDARLLQRRSWRLDDGGMSDGGTERGAIALPATSQGPAVSRGAGVDQHGRTAGACRSPRQVRPAGLLDLLLHQLHARPARAEEARRRPTPTSWSSSASTRPSSRPRRTRRTSPRPCSATRSSTRWSTTPTRSLWNRFGVQALAHPGADRSPRATPSGAHSGEATFADARRGAQAGDPLLSPQGAAR